MNFKHYLVINSKILLTHFIAQLISCVIGLFTFSNIVAYGWGRVVAFVIYTGFYIVSMYSKAYKIGEKDTKSYSENKPYPLKGLTMCVLTILVSSIMVVIYLYASNIKMENGILYSVLVNAFSLWNFNLCPMFDFVNGIGAVWYALAFIIPIASVFLGYLAGMNRYELGYKFFTKLVYKDKK